MSGNNKCCFDCGYSLSCSVVCRNYRDQSVNGGNWRCAPDHSCNNNCLHYKKDCFLADEYIIASAIMMDGHIFVGKRHGDAGKNYMDITGADKCHYRNDGFITSKLRFIDRKEAFILAKQNGQFKREELGRLAGCTNPTLLEELFSEDLW